MKRKLKKVAAVLMIGGCLLGNTLPVQAYTVPFDVTWPNDPTSPRSQKDDVVQFFYVTGYSFNNTKAVLRCRSFGLYNEWIYSDTAYISATGSAASAEYTGYAEAGSWCYMSTESTVNGFHVTGVYTP